jgi:probable phosphoglycerate mutase
MTKILLIRHGHVEGIKPARFRGRQPLDLTARGRAEAAAVAKRVAGSWQPSKIYSSPMGRCVETAAAIANACGITSEICGDLNDIDYGDWQFKTYQEAKDDDPALFETWFAKPHLVRFPSGEALQDVVARTANALRLVLTCYPEETVVFVGHDSSNRALLLQLLDQPLSAYWRVDQGPGCINEVDVANGNICVRRLNGTQHLDAVAADKVA